ASDQARIHVVVKVSDLDRLGHTPDLTMHSRMSTCEPAWRGQLTRKARVSATYVNQGGGSRRAGLREPARPADRARDAPKSHRLPYAAWVGELSRRATACSAAGWLAPAENRGG